MKELLIREIKRCRDEGSYIYKYVCIRMEKRETKKRKEEEKRKQKIQKKKNEYKEKMVER